MTLFEGPPSDRQARDHFYYENIASVISCVVAPDQSIRKLAGGVAKRLFKQDKVIDILRSSRDVKSPKFKTEFWRLT